MKALAARRKRGQTTFSVGEIMGHVQENVVCPRFPPTYSPKVAMNAGEVIFDGFAVGTSKGFVGYGLVGAAQPIIEVAKKLLEYPRSQGCRTVTLKGYYASEKGAALGAGKVGERFSFSFPATKGGLRDFVKGLKK
jgi:filamentous hemagglutinin